MAVLELAARSARARVVAADRRVLAAGQVAQPLELGVVGEADPVEEVGGGAGLAPVTGALGQVVDGGAEGGIGVDRGLG